MEWQLTLAPTRRNRRTHNAQAAARRLYFSLGVESSMAGVPVS